MSQVWLVTDIVGDGTREPVLRFTGDSDAHIVRGLIAVLLAVCSGEPAREILEIDALALFESLGLGEHLTPGDRTGSKPSSVGFATTRNGRSWQLAVIPASL